MAEQGTPSASPPPCSKGCGFFGSPSTMNMCSKCFREHTRSNPPEQTSSDNTGVDIQSSSIQVTPGPSSSSGGFSTPELRPSSSQAQATPSFTSPLVGTDRKEVDTETCTVVTTASGSRTPPPPPSLKVQKNKSRCWTCRKKIGLTGFECKCGYFFCSEHRYSDKHECTFDYQASAREQLKKANPVVMASKLDKI